MATVLKKRVVAELCQVSQSLAPPTKKLKAFCPQSVPTNLKVDLNRCKTTKEVLHALSSLKSFPISPDEVEATMDHLLSYFHLESCPSVRVRIIQVLHILIQYPCCNSVLWFGELLKILRSEKSGNVIAEIIPMIKTIGLLNYSDSGILSDILECSIQVMKNNNSYVRSKCLELIGHLGSHDMVAYPAYQSNHLKVSLGDMLLSLTMDHDWRVRLSALEAILLWHHRGFQLDWSLYKQTVLLLEDDQEEIRLAVIKLMWVIAQLNPDIIVEKKEGNERLIDDCFGNLCEAMIDISVEVRTQAALMLGSMHDVSSSCLHQTLEKKLMSNFRKKLSAHERQKELFISGEWAGGRRVTNDAPREFINPDSITITSKGACGAFVNGLEDEFSKVRNASLDSLCELSCSHPGFAQEAQDFVVDMLTDEIDSVRLNAINSLHKMSRMLIIRDDQLEIILGVLKDFYAYMREAAHRLLSSCCISTTTGMRLSIDSLLQNLKAYPEDKMSIWRVMKYMGRNQSSLVHAILPSLLGFHHFFDVKESVLDDPAYISLMILASNASPHCPAMTGILPSFIFNHFTNLKNVYPHLFPDIWLANEKESQICKSVGEQNLNPSVSSNQKKFLSAILSQLDKINFMLDIQSAYRLLEIAYRDLKKVDELAPEMSASSRFIQLHLLCQLKIHKILSHNQFSLTSKCPESLGKQIEKLLKTLATMKTIFVGITNPQLVEIDQLLLIASAIDLLFKYPLTNQRERKANCFNFSSQVMKLTDLLSRSKLPMSRVISHLTTELNAPQNSDTTNYHRLLISALRVHSSSMPVLPRTENQLAMMKATVVEPSGKSDFVHNFVPKYILPIRLVADLENIEYIEGIRIHVRYANQREYLCKPDLSDFSRINRMKHKLVTNVPLSHGLWSEPCQVQLQVVYLPATNVSLSDHLMSFVNDKLTIASPSSTCIEDCIKLSDVISTAIHPSAHRDTLF